MLETIKLGFYLGRRKALPFKQKYVWKCSILMKMHNRLLNWPRPILVYRFQYPFVCVCVCLDLFSKVLLLLVSVLLSKHIERLSNYFQNHYFLLLFYVCTFIIIRLSWMIATLCNWIVRFSNSIMIFHFRSQFALINEDLIQKLREILEEPAQPGESRVFTMARYTSITLF